MAEANANESDKKEALSVFETKVFPGHGPLLSQQLIRLIPHNQVYQ
jgi:hypothetical protein